VFERLSESIKVYNDHHRACTVCGSKINTALGIKCPAGSEAFRAVLTQCREAGMSVAT
jgi:hypothetical protein